MKITITIEDDDNGLADVDVRFHPELTEETRHSPAAKICKDMLDVVRTEDGWALEPPTQ